SAGVTNNESINSFTFLCSSAVNDFTSSIIFSTLVLDILTSLQTPLSLPLALQHKRGPVIWRLPLRLLQHLDLSSSKRRGRRHSILQHSRIEVRHQHRSRFIIDAPETDDYARGSGVHESASQPHKAFATDFLSKP